MPEKIYFNSRQEWLELRHNGIGASEIGAVLGLNPYSSPDDIYQQKIQKVVTEEPTNTFMQIGNDLEPEIVKKYSQFTGYEIEIYKDCLFYNPENPFLQVSLDGLIVKTDGRRGIFEAKTSRMFKIKTEAPEWYFAQVQQQMYVMELEWAHLVTHYYNINKTKIIQIPRNEAFIQNMIEKSRNFWNTVLEARQGVYCS